MAYRIPPGGVTMTAQQNQFRDALENLLERHEELRRIRDRHGLDRIIEIMRGEAEGIWRRLAHDSEVLNPASRDQNMQQPYPWVHIMETERYNAERQLLVHANPATRPIYERGQFTRNGSTENWIIRWNVHRAFRNRDHRRSGQQQNGDSSGGGNSRRGPTRTG